MLNIFFCYENINLDNNDTIMYDSLQGGTYRVGRIEGGSSHSGWPGHGEWGVLEHLLHGYKHSDKCRDENDWLTMKCIFYFLMPCGSIAKWLLYVGSDLS